MGRRRPRGGKWEFLTTDGRRADRIQDALPAREYKGRKWIRLDRHLIDSGRTQAGGFRREQLKALGIPWPPPAGWLRQAIGTPVTVDQYRRFLETGRADYRPPPKPVARQEPDEITENPVLARIRAKRLAAEANTVCTPEAQPWQTASEPSTRPT